MDRIEALMKEGKHYLDPHISLPYLVRVSGTNRTYLSRAIFWYCGAHFRDYVNGWRVREVLSKAKLGQNELSLFELALDCGFSHRRTFARAFIRETGIPPVDYVRELESEARDAE